MDPELEVLKDAYETALNHFNFALTDLEIDTATCQLNIIEMHISIYLNRAWHQITP
jgi:hypothetical protein